MTAEIRAALLAQAMTCEQGGSPMYAELLRRAAKDADGPVADLMTDGPDAGRALRLLGAVHRLVLEGRAPELAAHYPTAGGTADPLAAWPAFRALLADRPDEVRAAMTGAPQTNEVGRAAPLTGGLLAIMAAIGERPVRLLEVGASAGLNLRADHYRYESAGAAPNDIPAALGSGHARSSGPEHASASAGSGDVPGGPASGHASADVGFGPSDSPVVLRDCWLGSPPPLTSGLSIIERTGCDLAPVDPVADGTRLLSFVWPDQHERVARLRGALEVAARVPATVVRADAASFLEGVEPCPDVVTVVWHSIMWQYLSPAEQARVTASVERAGAQATPDAPFAHLHLEQAVDGDYHSLPVLTLRLWPHFGGERRVLADTPHHGVPARWR
ncbi:DUF2332 domain-containing protein [Actinomadura rupiterrae]|uniref:DUF2332 domain-containing protein n=1 Tax=Actinomadura rupiterrae TaxID=559627 RepID=UPI0020A34C08|nr:DUF2332 domain-containing protein [Actinomadura rupiterrae]MCP2338320.1 hypothetical protein [Actinomadura rupiterrae]